MAPYRRRGLISHDMEREPSGRCRPGPNAGWRECTCAAAYGAGEAVRGDDCGGPPRPGPAGAADGPGAAYVLGSLRGLDRATVAGRASELLKVLELTEAERTLVIDYSAGVRKKITFATALLHTPQPL